MHKPGNLKYEPGKIDNGRLIKAQLGVLMKTVIAGSRGITDPFVVDAAVRACGWRPSVVISGTARGVDRLGEDWATRNGVPVERMPADWRAHGNGAGHIRNWHMATESEAVVAIWDGVSPGTRNMIETAQRMGRRVYVHRYTPPRAAYGLPFGAVPLPPGTVPRPPSISPTNPAAVVPLPPGAVPRPPGVPVPPAPLVEVAARPRSVMDIECYRDFFLVKFCNIESLEFVEFDAYPGKALDVAGLCTVLERVTIVTFNGNHYDVPMLSAALKGYEPHALKQFSDAIILQNMKPWDFEKQYGIAPPAYLDHVDLIEVAPGVASLKMYGGKMHSRKMQDLPIDPAASISPADRVTLSAYCGNDLLTTIDLYKKFKDQIALREMLGKRYGLDLRSKSDAQIAEAVIKKQIGFQVQKRFIPHGYSFCYQVPDFIRYQTPPMLELLETVRRAPFLVSDKDQAGEFDHNGEKIKTGIMMPKELADAKIKIGNSTYKLGIGGLHSTESSAYHIADAEYEISDHDVASYYPRIILNQRLYPAQLGDRFLEIYQAFTDERLAAKHAGDKKKADTVKIVINGTFGKTGSKYSILYAPELLIQTTITGQLSLLMLIEALELHGIAVISANTDGIVVKCRRALGFLRDDIIKQWETATGFETEVARYAALFSRDVNSYMAFKVGGGVKLKGAYAPPVPVGPSWPNPTGEICVDAVVAFLGQGTPIEQTIRACTDVRKFVHIRTVKGGGVKDGTYLGKAVRWYYAAGEFGAIKYAASGNKVATTEGARPLMELPDTLPADVDYAHYVKVAYGMLDDFGIRA